MSLNQMANNFSVKPKTVVMFRVMGIDLKEVAGRWGVIFKEIEPQYDRHFISITPSFGFECVDDRARVVAEESAERGPQVPGASFAPPDIIKSLTSLDEDDAFEATEIVLKELRMPLAIHNDDAHGELTEESDYKERNEGCGYEKLVESEPEKIGLSPDPEVQDKKRWLKVRRAEGKVVTLTGDHRPQVAIINLKPDLTFNTAEAYEEHAAFNFDLGWLMEEFYPKLQEYLEQKKKIQLGRNQFANKALELYVRTVIALAPELNQFQIKAT